MRKIKIIISLTVYCSSMFCYGMTITNREGKVYTVNKIMRTEPDGITVMHDSGISKIFFWELSEKMQKKFHYDPPKAKAYNRRFNAKQARLWEQRRKKSVEKKRIRQLKQKESEIIDQVVEQNRKVPESENGVTTLMKDHLLRSITPSDIAAHKYDLNKADVEIKFWRSFSIEQKSHDEYSAYIDGGNESVTVVVPIEGLSWLRSTEAKGNWTLYGRVITEGTRTRIYAFGNKSKKTRVATGGEMYYEYRISWE